MRSGSTTFSIDGKKIMPGDRNRWRSDASRYVTIGLWAIIVMEALAMMIVRRPWIFGDSLEYLQLAGNLAHGHGFLSASPEGLEPSALRPPGYPLFLAGFLVLRSPLWVIVAFQTMLYLASVFIVYRYMLTRWIERCLFLAITIGYIFPLVYSVVLLSECLTIFFVAALLALLLRGKALSAGVVCGLATLVRGDMIFLVLFSGAYLWYKAGWRSASLAVVVSSLLLLPYAIWNYETFGKASPLPLATVSGQSVYLATWESSLKLDDLKLMVGGPVTPAAKASGFADQVAAGNAAAERIAPRSPYHPRQLQIVQPKVFMKAAIARIEANPIPFILHTIRSCWRLFNTGEFDNIRPVVQWTLMIVSSTIWLLSILGLLHAVFVSKDETIIVAGLLVIVLLVPHMPLHTEARYTAASRLLMMMSAATVIARTVIAALSPQTGQDRPVAVH